MSDAAVLDAVRTLVEEAVPESYRPVHDRRPTGTFPRPFVYVQLRGRQPAARQQAGTRAWDYRVEVVVGEKEKDGADASKREILELIGLWRGRRMAVSGGAEAEVVDLRVAEPAEDRDRNKNTIVADLTVRL